MKRLFYILLLFCTLLILCPSCKSGGAPKPLCWQTYPVKGQIRIEKEGKSVDAGLILEENKMTLTLGGQNEGTLFCLEGGEATLSAGDLTLPILRERLPEEGLLFDALTLPSDAPLLKSSEELEGTSRTVFTYVTDEVNFRYYLDENACLLRVVIEKEETIVVDFG